MKLLFLCITMLTFNSYLFAKTKQDWHPQYENKFPELLAEPVSGKKDEKKSIKKIVKKETIKKSVKKGTLQELQDTYRISSDSKEHLFKLKSMSLQHGGKAVPVLIEVIKNNSIPEKNRWVAIFALGRIAGKKASPFISKFIKHKNWIIRLAVLKTLLALKDDRFSEVFLDALRDKSLIVRMQAIENIKKMKIQKFAPYVWSMLFHEHNYRSIKGKLKRTPIIKEVIKAVGELKYSKAKGHLLRMIQKNKYDDIFTELDYSLGHLLGKDSPNGDKNVKKIYWARMGVKQKTF